MKTSLNCAKCGGRMSPGFLLDQGYGGATVGAWQEGEPRKSIWTGVKQKSDAQREIVTWCCDRCGYLESYAAER